MMQIPAYLRPLMGYALWHLLRGQTPEQVLVLMRGHRDYRDFTEAQRELALGEAIRNHDATDRLGFLRPGAPVSVLFQPPEEVTILPPPIAGPAAPGEIPEVLPVVPPEVLPVFPEVAPAPPFVIPVAPAEIEPFRPPPAPPPAPPARPPGKVGVRIIIDWPDRDPKARTPSTTINIRDTDPLEEAIKRANEWLNQNPELEDSLPSAARGDHFLRIIQVIDGGLEGAAIDLTE